MKHISISSGSCTASGGIRTASGGFALRPAAKRAFALALLLLASVFAVGGEARAQGTYTIGLAGDYGDEYGLGEASEIIRPALTVTGSGTLTEDLRVVYWISETSQSQVSNFGMMTIWPQHTGGTAEFGQASFTPAQVAAAAADGTPLVMPQIGKFFSINEGAGYRINLVQSIPSRTFGAGAADTITVAVNRPNGAVYEMPAGAAVPFPAGVNGFGASGRADTTGTAIAATGHFRENRPVADSERLVGWTESTVRVREGEVAILPFAIGSTNPVSIGNVVIGATISTDAAAIRPISPQDLDARGAGGRPDGVADSAFPITGVIDGSIAFNRRSGQVRIRTIDDNQEEPPERFLVQIDSVAYSIADTDHKVITVLIDDNDGPPPGIAVTGPDAVEEGVTATYTLALTLPLGTTLSDAVTIDYEAAGSGSGGAGGRPAAVADFGAGASSGSVTFAAGSTRSATQTIRLPITDDNLNEGTETFVVQLQSDSAAVPVSPTAITAAIAPDSDDTVVISIVSRQTLLRQGPGGQPIDAQGNFLEGTTADLELFSSFRCLGGQATGEVRLTYTTERFGDVNEDGVYFRIGNDSVQGEGEITVTTDTITMTADFVNDAGPGRCRTGNHQMLFPDDNYNEGSQTVVIRFDESVAESVGPVTIRGSNEGDPPGQWSINRFDNDATIITATAASRRFNEGEPAVFNIALGGGMRIEDVPLQWRVTTGGGAPTTITPGDFTSGNFPGGAMLTEFPSGTLTIRPDDTARAITLQLAGDPDTALEPFALELSVGESVRGDYILAQTGVAAAIDGELRQSVTMAAPAPAAEGTTATAVLTLGLTDSNPLGAELNINYRINLPSTGAAANPAEDADFEAGNRSGTITFAAAAVDGATATITLPIVNDNLNEGTETFVVQLEDAIAVNLPVRSVSGEIAPDENDTLVVTVLSRYEQSRDSNPEGEGGNPGQFMECTGGEATEAVRFTYTTERIGEVNEDGVYFRFFNPLGSLVTTDAVTLSVAGFNVSNICAGGAALLSPDDNYNEGSQTVILRFAESVGESAGPVRVEVTIGSQDTIAGEWTIVRQDNDPSTVRFIPDTPRTGFDESAAAVFNIEVSGGTLAETVPLQWRVSTDGIISGAVSADDFTDDDGNPLTALPSGVELLERGTTEAVVSITLALNSTDAADEFREAFTFSLSLPSTARGIYNLIPPPVRGAIAGRHRQRITAETAAAAEGATASITLTLDLSSTDLTGAPTMLPADMAVTWLALPGPADSANPAELADIAAAAHTGEITFASGAADGATAAISLPITDDNLNEGTETWTVVLDGDDGATGTPEAITADIPPDPADAIVVTFPAADVSTYISGITSVPISEGIRGSARTPLQQIQFTGGAATEDLRLAYTLRREGEALTGRNYINEFIRIIGGPRTSAFGADECPAGAAQGGDTLCFSWTPYYVNGGDGSNANFSFRIPIPDDNFNEGTQTISFRFRTAVVESAGPVETTGGPVRLIFPDDDTSTITLRASTTATGEDGVVRITAEVGGAIPGADLPLDYAFETTLQAADFNDDSGAALSALDGTLTVPAMTTSAELTLRLRDDNLYEPDETQFALTFTPNVTDAATRYPFAGGSTNRVVIAVSDNDNPRYSLTASTADAAEGDRVRFTARLTNEAGAAVALQTPVTLTYTATLGAGEANAAGLPDFTDPGGGTLVIPAGETSAAFTVRILNDGIGEAAETLTITLTAALPDDVTAGAPLSASVQIAASEETGPRLTLEGPSTLAEPPGGLAAAAATATYTVTLGGFTTDTTVNWSVAGSGARGTTFADYNGAQSGMLAYTIAGGGGAQTFSFVVAPDDLNEGDETLQIELTAQGVPTLRRTATITDNDDDSVTAELRDSAATAAEGDTIVAHIDLSGGERTAPVAVDYRVLLGAGAGSAAAADFTGAIAGRATIAAAATTAEVRVATLDDNLNEPSETFRIGVESASGAGRTVLGSTTRTQVTLTDNDPTTLTVVQAPGGAVEEGGSAMFRVEASGGELSEAVALRWNATTATDVAVSALPPDFGDGMATGFPGGNVTINAGAQASPVFAIALFDDALNETDEQYNVELDAVDDARYPREALTGLVIADNDDIVLSFEAPPPGTRLAEGATHTFTVGVEGPAQGSGAGVSLAFGGDGEGDAGEGDAVITAVDGQALAVPATSPFTLNVEATRTVTLRINDDNLNEGDERLALALSRPAANGGIELGAAARVEVVIAQSDPMTATLSANAATVQETNDARFTVTLDGGVPSGDVTVAYDFSVVQNHTSGGVAATIEQHPGRPDILDRGLRMATIAAGATQGAITLHAYRDGYEESTETLTLMLTGITAAGEAALAEPTTAAMAITPSGTAFRVVRASLAGAPPLTSGGVAMFREPGAAVGGSFGAVQVDFRVLAGEGFSTDSLGLPNQEVALSFTSDDAQSAAALGAVPAVGADVGSISSSIDPANGSGVVQASITSDSFNEGTETFVVQIRITDYDEDADDGDGAFVDRGTVIEYETPVFGSFGIAAFRGLIVDHPDDTLIASVADTSAVEGATASFTVTLSGATATADTTVPYSVLPDAPVNPVAAGEVADAGGGVLTIPQGEAGGAILVTTAGADNELNEATRHFTVQLLPGAASRGPVTRSETASSAVGAIVDDDDILIESLAAAFDGDEVMEGDIAEFVVAVNHPSAGDFTLRWQASAGGPTQPVQPCSVSDLCFVPGARGQRFMPAGDLISAEVTFAAGATTAAFSFIVNQDNMAEAREMLTVQIDPDEVRAGPRSGVITPTLDGGATAQADLHIAANDAAMRFLTAGNAASMRVREGDVASFDVALSGDTPASAVMVRWAVDSDTGADPNATDAINMAEPTDYAPASGELRFTPDNFTEPQTAFITIADDDLNESTETLVVRLFGTMGGVSTDDAAIAVSGTVVMNIRQSDPLTWAITERPPESVAEDAGDLRYEITLSNRSEGRISVPLVVSGTATAGAPDDPARDVALPPPTMTVATTATAVFAIGATRAEVTLTVHDDSEFEHPETVIVELPAAAGTGGDARTGPATRAPREADYRAITTIRDNDNAVLTLARSVETVAEGGSAAFTATLDGVALALDVEIDYSVGIVAQAGIGGAQNTAANPDFTPGFTPGADTTGTLAIAAGTTQTTLTYQIVRDGLAENDETLRFELQPREGGNVSVRGGATTSIVVQSTTAPLRLSAAPAPGYAAAVAEGDAIAWRVEVAPTGSVTPETLVLHYAVVDGDGNAAGAGADIGFANGRVFSSVTRTEVGWIPATQTFTLTTPELTVYRDGAREGAETLFLSVSLGVTATIPANQQAIETLQMTLPLTDGRVDATLAVAASDRPENGPPAPLLTTLPAAPGNTTAVVVMEGDVLSVGALLPGVEIPRDWRIGFTLQSTGPGGADLQNDLDLSAVFSQGAGESFFPVSITGTSVVSATLVGSVFADAPDDAPRYTTAATLLIPVAASDGIEEDESFLITLTNPSPSLRLGDADAITRLVTIQSPEAAAELADLDVTVTPPDGEVIEGDAAVFTISVANDGRTAPVNVAWQVGVGTSRIGAGRARGASDIDSDAVIAASAEPVRFATFQATETIFIDGVTAIAPTASAATLAIPITDDADAERAETFTVSFFSASGGGAFRRAVIGRDFEVTIAANDARLQIRRDATAFAPDAVAEGETARFIVSPIGGGAIEQNITAAWQVVAADGSTGDWNPAAGSVTLTPANPEQTIEIMAVADGLPEPREDFTVQLPDESTGANIAIARSIGTANLVSVRAVAAAVTESASAQAVFVVEIARRTLATSAMVTVTLGGDAVAGDDYTAPASTALELPAGVDRAEFPVALMDDADAEYDEALTLSIAGAMDSNGGALPFMGGAAAISVIDDDRDAVSLALAGPFDADGELLEEIAEGTLATFTLTATGLADGGAMQVTYTFGDDTDAAVFTDDVSAAGADYFVTGIGGARAATGELTLTDAAPEHTFTVAALTDNISEPAETFSVRADSPAANGADPLTVAIAADASSLTLSVSAPGPQDGDFSMFPGGFSEGDIVRFEVRVSGGLDRTVQLPWRLAGVSVLGPDGMTAPASADDFAAGDDTAADITMPGPTAGTVTLTPENPIAGVMVALRLDAEAEPAETFELRVDAAGGGLAVSGGADAAAVATIFANDAVELPAPPVFAPGDGSVALTGPDDMLAGETGEWTAEWTGAPSDEPVTLTVVFNGVAGLTRRACFEDLTEGASLGCTLIESEAAIDTVGATLLRWQARTAVTDFVSVRATATEVDVIFQQPLSSTQRSIVFNAPVRRGDRVSFRVMARNELLGSAPAFLDSDGNTIISPPRRDPRFDQSIPSQDPAVVHRDYLNGVFMGSAPGPGDLLYQGLRPIRTDFPGDQTAQCLNHRPGGFLPDDLPCAGVPARANPGLETDESFTLHLEDGVGGRRSNAAATIIRRAAAGLLTGPSHMRVGVPAIYTYDKFSNPVWDRLTTFGNFWRVEAATLGGPVTRECQIATPADFGGAFPSAITQARIGRDASSFTGSTTEGGFPFTVNAADIVLADSGPCATKYFRVVLDPAQPLIDEFLGSRARPSGWNHQTIAYVDTDAPINRGGAHFNAPVSRLVSISTEPVRGRTGGFLVARLGAPDHPSPSNAEHSHHDPKPDAGPNSAGSDGGTPIQGSITGQYLGMLHSHYSGGRLVEGTTRRFTVSYYGPALRSDVMVPWHIEGVADAAAQFERASGFVTFPAGLEGGSLTATTRNAYLRFDADSGQCNRIFINQQRTPGSVPTFCVADLSRGNYETSNGLLGLRTLRVARVRVVEGSLAVQRGIDITPRNDAIAEGEQPFRVVLGEPIAVGGPALEGALAGAGESADGVIAASDSFRRVALDGPAGVLTPGQASTFSIVWSGALPATDTAVQWQISGDAAGLFSPDDGTVTFAQGDAAAQSFTLTPMATATTSTFGVSLTPADPPADMPPYIWRSVPETLPFDSGTVPVNLPTGVADAIEGYAGAPAEFTVAQTPPMPEPTSSGIGFQLACPDSVAEGEEAFCTLTYVGPDPVAEQIDITYSIGSTGVNAAVCADFTATLCGGLDGGMFAAGSAVGTTTALTFQPLADSVIELDEEFTITVEPLISGSPANDAVILDNEQVVRIRGQIAGASLAAQSADAGEGGDIAFAISLARATTAEVSVAWQVRAVAEGGRAAVELADLGDGAGGSLADAQDGDEFTFGDVRGFVSTGAATTILTGTAVFAEIAAVGTQAETLTVTLPAFDDALNEPQETLEMVLPEVSSAVAGYVIVGADGVTTRTVAATITLHDNDTARISIERADTDGFVEGPVSAPTGTRTAQFRVRAAGGAGFQLATTAMVSVLVSGAAPGDFEASTDTLMLAPGTAGVPSATLVITAVDNNRNEPPRTLLASLGRVEIAGAFEYTERVEAGAVLDDDDDITATLTPPEQTVEENGAATLTLELDRAAAAAVSVPYTVAPAQTAGATADDFAADAALEGVFELAAGATMASVELAVVVDAEAETTETAVATLGAAVVPAGIGAVETSGMATVRIAQNTAAARTLNVSGGDTRPDNMASEMDTPVSFTAVIDISGGAESTFTTDTEVRWEIEHITTSDADFGTTRSGSFVVRAGTGTTLYDESFVIAGDNLNEGPETFRILLSVDDPTADGGTIIGAPPTITVHDDDRLGIVFRATTGTESVSMAETTTVAEGTTTPLATILATLTDAVPSGAVTATFAVTGDGVDASDFDITTPTGIAASATTGTLVFAQGRTTAVIVLTVLDDDLSEGDETVRVERGAQALAAGGFRAATASDAAQFTIAASDSALFAVEDAASSVAEGETARLAVTLGGGALAATATLAWRAVIADQTNTSVRDPRRLNTLQQPDLAAESGVVMVPANSTRAEVEIAALRDGREEDDEEVLVTLTAESDTLTPDPAADGANEARFVIAANEAAANFLTWSLDTRRAAEGTTATLTMVLSGRPLGASVVSARIVLDDAADVTGGAPAARMLANFGTQTISLGIRDDDLNEAEETLQVSVRAARDGDEFEVLESETTRTITIPMSDPTTITVASARPTPEGTDAVFPLSLAGGRLAEAVSVAWSVTSTNVLTNAATADDFGDGTSTSLPSSSVTIEAGERRAEIRVALFADTDDAEEDEQFMLLLDSSDPGPPRYRIGADAAVGSISGVDRIPPTLEALPWLPGQRAIWLVADENLFVAATDTAAASLPRGTALQGFSVGRGADQAQASAAAAAVSAAYQPLRGIALALAAPLADDGGRVFVFYDYPGAPATGIFDTAPLATGRNQMTTQTVVVVRSINGDEDFDGDGLPDATEIAAGENPLTAGGVAGLPTVTIGRDSPAHFAYSGVRAGGALAHLGVSAAPPQTRLSAWYLSDTFGFEGTYPEFEMTTRRYGCNGQFPAQFRLPPAQGGCEPVDWENVRVGVEHRVGWLALNANGLWAVNTATVSNLPEQTVRRVPEVRMDAAQLYANDTQTATVAASHDGAGDNSLVMEFSTGMNVVRIAAGAGGARFVTMTRVSATWEIAGVTTSAAAANTDLLWRAGAGVGGLSAASYSLGAVTRTRVDYVGSAAVAPVFGRATLVRGGDVVAALVAGVSGYRLDVRVGSLGAGATVTARDTAGVLAGANAPSVSVADHIASVSFDVPGDAATTGTVAILLNASNPGGGAATATLVYSVVAAANPLALANDADNDGISDFYDWFDAVTTDDEPRRSYGGAALLPVSVADTGGTTGIVARVAGMVRGHHIRPVLPQHELRIGPATRERLQARAAQVAAAVAASEEDELRYNDFAASRFSDNAAGQLEVVYDFEIHGVEPELSEGRITGGRAGVIIPLSRSFLAATGDAQLRPVKEAVGADGTGAGAGAGAGADDATREFSRDAADGDYGFAQYIGDINDEDGRCPDAGNGAYTLGPGRGDCLLLWIVDGGANDDDGVRNGVIQDPVRVIRGAATGGGSRSHSGTIDPLGLLTLLALSTLTLLRRRRPNPARRRK